MAPILCFTGDEVWQAMPHRSGDDPENVLFNDRNKPFTDYALGDWEMTQWGVLSLLRDGVNSALETARAAKQIGKSLEADIVLMKDPAAVTDNLSEIEKRFDAEALADLFIVSGVSVVSDAARYADAAETAVEGVRAAVVPAAGQKCARCWKQRPDVGTVEAHPTLCPRCAAVVAKL